MFKQLFIISIMLLLLGCSSDTTGVTDVESGISAQVLYKENQTIATAAVVSLLPTDMSPGDETLPLWDTCNAKGYVHYSVPKEKTYTLYCSDSSSCGILEEITPKDDTVRLNLTTPTSLSLSFGSDKKGFCFIPGTPLLFEIDTIKQSVTFPKLPREIISAIDFIEDTTTLYTAERVLSNIDLTGDKTNHFKLINSLWDHPDYNSNFDSVTALYSTSTGFYVGTKHLGLWYSSDQINWSNTSINEEIIDIIEVNNELIILTASKVYFTSSDNPTTLNANTPSSTEDFRSMWSHNDTLYVVNSESLFPYNSGSWLPALTGANGLNGGVSEPDGTIHLTSNSGTWQVSGDALVEVTVPSEQFNNDSISHPQLLPDGSLIVSSKQGGFWHYNSMLWYYYEGLPSKNIMLNDTLGLKISNDFTITTFTVKETLHSDETVKTTIPYHTGSIDVVHKGADGALYVVHSIIGIIRLKDNSILE